MVVMMAVVMVMPMVWLVPPVCVATGDLSELLFVEIVQDNILTIRCPLKHREHGSLLSKGNKTTIVGQPCTMTATLDALHFGEARS
jgi:hypothetical protein